MNRVAPIDIKVRALQIPMRHRFKHSSAERSVSESIWVEASRGEHTGLGEGCPRLYVTGETQEQALGWVKGVASGVVAKVRDLESLQAYVGDHRSEIDRNPSAWCALEIALLDLFGKEQGLSLEQMLGVSEVMSVFQYTAVVSDDGPEKLAKTLVKYLQFGFWDFKFKLNGDAATDLRKIEVFKSVTTKRTSRWKLLNKLTQFLGGVTNPPFRLRVDANNFWSSRDEEATIRYLAGLGCTFSGIEEPFEARAVASLSRLSVALRTPVILDESLCRIEDLALFEGKPGVWIPNIRVSKVGGVLRALEIARKVKSLGWSAIVGAQVGETSVLSRAALVVARELGDRLFAQEGAFGTRLLSYDPVTPEVRWSMAGRLVQKQGAPGLGLGLRDSAKSKNAPSLN